MLKYLEKLYFLNFCIPYTYFKFILAKLKQKNLYVRFTKKYQQTLVKPIFIKLGCQIVTRITIRNYQTSVSISIDIFIYTLQLCDNLLTPSLKLWDKTQYLARVWNLEKQDAVCFCLLWVYQSPSLEQSALKSSLGWCPGDFSMSWNQSETICPEWGSRWVEVCLYFLKQNSYGSSSKKKFLENSSNASWESGSWCPSMLTMPSSPWNL